MTGRVLITVALVRLFLSLAPTQAAEPPSQGAGWGELAKRVDPIVATIMHEHRIVGMTVAVTKGGRLVLVKGYGYAKANATSGGLEFVPMGPMIRTRIGSVSKATITGPAGYQLLRSKGIDPKSKRVYGPGGIFGTRFDNDIRIGVNRFSPIVALAISPRDRVYAWYVDGTYSVGSSRDLDRYEGRRPFKLPAGRRITDIRAIAIAGSSSLVYTWYNDGTVSVGRSWDLGAVRAPDPEQTVTLPRGKTMFNVVGVAIAKSNDRVHVWYDDGTTSIGTSRNFARYVGPGLFRIPAGRGFSPYQIRGIGMASDDDVYTWFANGKVAVGTRINLGKQRSPYSYSLPPLNIRGSANDRWVWWRSVTVQHLLDHRSGFYGSGDVAGAVKMFGVPESNLTYEHVHRHFLRTRPLRWRPGAAWAYSNHGFGLWTLIIEKVSGESYRDYVTKRYLAPLGMATSVRPMSARPDRYDADPYNIVDGRPVRLAHKESSLGLAAGGWTASARSLLWITTRLAKQYSPEELDAMGWGRESRGKLEHSGLIDGGTAYVAIFPKGYRSRTGVDLSETHVALAANTRVSTAALEQVATLIALAIPASGIPSSYDLWEARFPRPSGPKRKPLP